MKPPVVACVLRTGGEFKLEHAVTLLHEVEAFWPSGWPIHRVLLTDFREPRVKQVTPAEVVPLMYDWRGWWSKLELCRPDLEDLGNILYFDLDTVITGELTDIASQAHLTMLDDFYRPQRMASGLMLITPEARAVAWEGWRRYQRTGIVDIPHRRLRGDQDFFAIVWQDEQRWQRILPGQVISFKAHIKRKGGKLPPDARVVCFHGKPRPWEVGRSWLNVG